MNDIKYGRKRNGIKRQLDKKISEWLDSIDNEDVRNAAMKDVIVTGGSIASMLLGESVNDYDVYFRTKETTIKIANYYVKKFKERVDLKKADYVASNIEPVVKVEKRKNIKGDEEERVIIYIASAGVAGEQQSTYEYFENLGENDVAEFAESLIENESNQEEKYRPIFLSENAITLSNKFQLVTRFYGEPEEIHSNYDFIHAMNYYDYHKGQLVFHPEALECLLSRTLVYEGSLYPVASIFRTKKFVERGWRITAGQLLKIMWQISEIDLTDPEVLRDQLQGVDMAYMWQLIQALEDVNPEKINSTYVATIIDRIFE